MSAVWIAASVLAAAAAIASPHHEDMPGLRLDVSPLAPTRLFVELDAAPVSRWHALRSRRDGRPPSPHAQRLHAARVERQQLELAPAVAQLARIDARQRVAINGFRVRAPRAHVAALRALPGVRRVLPLALHRPDLTGSVPWVGVPPLWADGRGAGVRVAIIDTGIDYTHRAIGGSGDPDDFANNDPAVIEAGTFPTARVENGFDFAGPTYDARDPDAVPEPDPDPLDIHGHGTHVAGIVAGTAVDTHLGAGVAPAATLLALKVFSDNGGSTDLVGEAIEMALDPNGDGAIDDRVDVINMSLGSAFGDPADPSAIAAENAVAAGVIVVASAGNRANVPYVTGSPAVAPGVISVAASWPGNRTHPALAVAGQGGASGLHEAREGLGPVTVATRPVQSPLVLAQRLSPNSGHLVDACGSLDNAAQVTGNIALAMRGDCAFDTQYRNAQLAGAAALVVFNDGSTAARMRPQTMSGLGDDIAIPGVMIGFDPGTALRTALEDGHPLIAALHSRLRVAADPRNDDTLAWFTSRGPGHGNAAFKPDLAAPGYGIRSAASGTGFDGRSLNGTSMAAPHIVGAAALARERDAGITAAEFKAMLQVTAVDANRDGPGSATPYPLTRQGTGIVRIDRALAARTLALPAGLSFGRIEVSAPLSRVVTTRLVNTDSVHHEYSVRHRPNQTVPGVTLSCPGDLGIDAGASRAVTLTLAMDPALMPAERGGQTQTEVDGWCEFDDGSAVTRVGYLAVVDPLASVSIRFGDEQVELINDGPGRGFAEAFTLLAAPGLAVPGRAAVSAVGLRRFDLGGFPLIEFAFALADPWESPSQLSLALYVDADEDGREDFLLRIADWSRFGGTTGSMATLQYPLDAHGEPIIERGFIDWLFDTADYNDQVMIAPFTLIAAAGEAFLDPQDRAFGWRLVVTARDGRETGARGRIDFALTAPPARLVLDTGETLTVPASPQSRLWLYPANAPGRQYQALPASAPPRLR